MAIDVDFMTRLRLLAQAVDQLDMGLTVFNRELVLIVANRRFQDMLHFPDALCQSGARMEDCLRYNAEHREYGPGDVEQQVRERLELAQRFLPHRFERARPDGTIIEVIGQPLPDGGMVTTYQDVTIARRREQALGELKAELELRVQERTAELRRREAELAHKAALLELVVSHVDQGISYFNAQLELELCNQRFQQLLDLPDSLCRPGMTFEAMAHFNAERGEYGAGEPAQLAQDRVVAARRFERHHFERTRPNGGRTLEIMGIPTPDGGIVSTYLDVSERKAAEQRIQALNATLEARVAQRSAELQAAHARLQQSQEELSRSAARATLGTLVASVTHELSTPLGNSLIAASTCSDHARRLHGQLEANQLRRSELQTFIDQMRTGSELVERNLHRAVELMRNFKQVAADQASEQRRRFDLGIVVAEVIDTLGPSLKRQPQQLRLDVDPDIAMDSYPGALGQVLINAINNAYLHAFEGRASGQVCVQGRADADWVHLSIADDGVGMSAQLQAQLFEPFFSTKIGRGGTGLGMTIMDNLVKKTLGGSLRVQSEPGAGTRLVLKLPRKAPEPEREALLYAI